jgi:hypothetical protein
MTRRLQGNYKTMTRQQGCEGISYGATGGRGNEAIDKKITNQTFALIFFASFPHDTKVANATNEMAIWTQR